ncbi:hypothetical protein CRG98_036032 [Punica granatum]|uniref:Uncharacterized protein n=1 Tax=Punica granatum TaxID=22663 RepID=A0A2I0IIH6_PUNGR|nr:hypothetical protein CRG98_036032 [Punica granatum]
MGNAGLGRWNLDWVGPLDAGWAGPLDCWTRAEPACVYSALPVRPGKKSESTRLAPKEKPKRRDAVSGGDAVAPDPGTSLSAAGAEVSSVCVCRGASEPGSRATGGATGSAGS